MRLHRRSQNERRGPSGEVPCPHKLPLGTPFIGHRQFIGADVEGCSLPAIGRLYLNQLFASVRLETGNIVAVTVAILLRSPARLADLIVAANDT